MYVVRKEAVFVEGEAHEETRWQKWGNKAKRFYENHKAECIMVVTAGSMIIKPICNTIKSVFSTSRKAKLMKNSVYDRSENHHWFLRKQPTNAQWYEIQRRKRNGERLGDILASMHLLK